MIEDIPEASPKESGEIPGKLRIGVDWDWTVTTYPALIKWVKTGVMLLAKSGGNTERTKFLDRLIRKQPTALLAGLPFQFSRVQREASQIINKWREQGYEIYFICGRPEKMRKKAQRVLEESGLAWAVAENRLHLRQSDETTVDFKRRVAETLNLHVFIDDDPENIQATPSMFLKIFPRQPWNVRKEVPKTVVAQDWPEIDKLVQGLSRWHYFVSS